MLFVFALDEGKHRTAAKLISAPHSCLGISSRNLLENKCMKQNLCSFITALQKEDKTKTSMPTEDFELIKFQFFTSSLRQEL